MLVNSSPTLIENTKKILERCGYDVRCASDPGEARQLIKEREPDGIVLDNELPNGGGLEYCRELRKEGSMPILYFSNYKEDEIPAKMAGADDFVKKPFDIELLKVRISTMLRNSDGRESEIAEVLTLLSGALRDNGGDNGADDGSNRGKLSKVSMRKIEEIPPEDEERINKRNKVTMYLSIVVAAACIVLAVLAVGGSYLLTMRDDYSDISGIAETYEQDDKDAPGEMRVSEERAPETDAQGEQTATEPQDAPNVPGIEIFDDQVPLAAIIIDKNAKSYNGVAEVDTIQSTSSIMLPANETVIKSLLLNPAGNTCYYEFEIVLAGTAEILYTSDLVPPGICIEEIVISRGLEPGKYTAIINIRAYALEDMAYLNSTITGTTIVVE